MEKEIINAEIVGLDDYEAKLTRYIELLNEAKTLAKEIASYELEIKVNPYT